MDKWDALQFAAEEADHRAIRFRPVEILDFVPSGRSDLSLCPAGTITLFFVRREGAALISRIRGAVSAPAEDQDVLAEEIQSHYSQRNPVSYNRAWRLLRRQAVFADVRCGGRTLATNLFLPEDLPVGVLSFPYNGGALPAATLTLVEHHQDDIEDELEAIALRNPGDLTAAERVALEQVPEEQTELNIAPVADCCPDVTGMIILVLMTLALAVERQVESISEDRLRALSPEASARELMEVRREALGHSH